MQQTTHRTTQTTNMKQRTHKTDQQPQKTHRRHRTDNRHANKQTETEKKTHTNNTQRATNNYLPRITIKYTNNDP